jgi:hypothetical protein
MSIAFRAALAAVVVMSVTALSRADEKEDIKKSGQAFAKALHDGNIKEAKQYAVSDSKSQTFIDAIAPVTVAREKMVDAAVAKFGDEGKSIFGGPRAGQAAAAPQYNPKDFDDAQFEVNGDTATVRTKNADRPLKFKKEGGTWKVDLTNSLSDEQLDRVIEMMPKVATAMDQTTADIKDGKYKTATEARQGLGRHMAAAMGFGGAGGPPRGGQR